MNGMCFLEPRRKFLQGHEEPSSLGGWPQANPAHFSQNPASTAQAVWAVATEVHSFLFIETTLAKVRCPQAKTSRP